MADLQLDPRPYFMILHSLLRHGELDYDRERISKNVEWLLKNSVIIRKTCSTAEFGVLMTWYAFWDRHGDAPSRTLLEELVRMQQGHKLPPEGLVTVLVEYDKHEDDLIVQGPIDLHAYLDQRREATDQIKLAKALNLAQQINVGSLTPDKNAKDQTIYKGPSGALQYLHKRVTEGILIDDAPTQGGLLLDTADVIQARYDRTVSDNQNNNLFIKTGIDLIDNHLGGLRRKEVNGVLGYVAQRKTGVVRTIGYHAALAGFRVLHIPLESDYEEEENAYTVLSAQTFSGDDRLSISKTRLERGVLSDDEQKVYFGSVLPWYKQQIAGRITVYTPGASRSWADVRAIIERETNREPVDLVIIDYMTLLSTPGNRDDVADKLAAIQDAKRLAMTANDGAGLCILTPIQGNREGYKYASENDGMWLTTGIAKYSELDKSLDNCFYVFFNDDMNNMEKATMKMGSCKTRRNANIPSTFVEVDRTSGMVLNLTGMTNVDLGAKKDTKEKKDSKDKKPESVAPELDALKDMIQDTDLEPA